VRIQNTVLDNGREKNLSGCREMSQLEEEARRKGLNVRIRNAEPYREFQNNEDNDRSASPTGQDQRQVRINDRSGSTTG
jgi:hypothetical protein